MGKALGRRRRPSNAGHDARTGGRSCPLLHVRPSRAGDGLAFFVGLLGFHLVEDTVVGTDKRWVVAAPPQGAARLLLARAVTDQQRSHIGQQTGGRVAFFLHTNDFEADHQRLVAAGVAYTGAPRNERYGQVAVPVLAPPACEDCARRLRP